jgi:UV DNA damage endonuclease
MTTTDEVRFRTITRTSLHKHSEAAQRSVLLELYRDNARRLGRGFGFCKRQGIPMFRMSSDLFPFADTPLGMEVLEEMREELARLGDTATGLRLVMHPDQYVVLSSDTPHVVENARQALIMHGKVLDLLGQPRTPEAAIIIHGGKGGRNNQLARQIELLPDSVRSRLVLENDERAYSASEILGVCKDSGVPMVFDAHHHVVHEGLDSYDHPSVAAALWAAANTWKDPGWQLTHISNGRDGFNDRRHSDFISVMPASYREAPWIEVEAKAKEQAVARLHDMGW